MHTPHYPSGPSNREMYYNIKQYKEIKETKANTFHPGEMMADGEVPEPVADGRPLGSASPGVVLGQEACGSGISPTLRFEWITAQWAFRKQHSNPNPATRLSVMLTFMLPEEIGTGQRPHKITFYLTDRWREFQAVNLFQQRIQQMAQAREVRWIGKARVRQQRNQPVEDHHRRNIPDLVMTATLQDQVVVAQLYSPQQEITLRFDQPLSAEQRRYYQGGAQWGRVPRRRARDDFYDWLRHA